MRWKIIYRMNINIYFIFTSLGSLNYSQSLNYSRIFKENFYNKRIRKYFLIWNNIKVIILSKANPKNPAINLSKVPNDIRISFKKRNKFVIEEIIKYWKEERIIEREREKERVRNNTKQYDPSKVWELSALTTLHPQSHVMVPTCHASASNTNDIMCARAYFSEPSIIDRFRKLNAMDVAQREREIKRIRVLSLWSYIRTFQLPL